MEIERSLSEFRLNFFTHIAHEFRTPLAIIQGAIDKICDAGDNHPPRSAVATAMRGTRRLSRLVDRLMEFRKINANSLRLRVEPGDVIGFVHDVLNDFLPMARQKGISLTFTPFARSFEMPFDRHMVETITYNLLSNAIKYTPQKGSVELTVKLGENENSITIAVADTGPGIAAEQQEHLFEPFMHGYVSQGGMGIGLSLAKTWPVCTTEASTTDAAPTDKALSSPSCCQQALMPTPPTRFARKPSTMGTDVSRAQPARPSRRPLQ